jgi:hypothetical protein
MTAESASWTAKLYLLDLLRLLGQPASPARSSPENNGLTACLDPETGEVIWLTNQYYVTAKCTLTGRDGRIYIGGYNPASEETKDRFVWCLDARDGSLIWQSDPVTSALNVVTVGEDFIFSNALRGRGNVFHRETGGWWAASGTTMPAADSHLSEPYILGANMDMIDLSPGWEAGLDRACHRFPRMPGSDRLQRTDLLHLAGQRLRRLANVWRGGSRTAGCLGSLPVAGSRRSESLRSSG